MTSHKIKLPFSKRNTFPLSFALFHLSALVTALIMSTALRAQEETYWWNNSVFYEVFVRSFQDSDGDGIGDLQGLIDRLDYLNDGDPETTSDLGITGIWLMPIHPSPSDHGYDVTDYRNINPSYGSIELFSTFVEAAHARGIKVIIDLVLNHTSNQHPWFQSSTYEPEGSFRDWYIWEDHYPGYQGPWGQQVWYAANGAFYFGLFSSVMPDLNYHSQAVRDEMFAVTAFWLDSLQVDGFRLDAIRHLFENGQQFENQPETFIFLEEWRDFYKAVNPDAMSVGEVWADTYQVSPYVDGEGMDFCFEFALAQDIRDGVRYHQPYMVRNQMTVVENEYPFLQYAPFLSNHDMDRVFNVLGEDMGEMKLAAAVHLTLPGIPFIYYGNEVAMQGEGAHENIRRPMQWSSEANGGFTTGTPWLPLNNNYLQYNVESMQDDEESLWHWYRTLIELRNEHEALRIGDYAEMVSSNAQILTFSRESDNQLVVVLHNFTTNTISQPTLTLYSSSLPAGMLSVVSLETGAGMGIVELEADGGFTNWQYPGNLDGQSTVLLEILPGDINGCVDPLALNYDPYATVDDGSCLYTEQGDMTADLLVDILDIIFMISTILEVDYEYSLFLLWAGDLNTDGTIDVLDVIQLVDCILFGCQ